MAGTGSAGRAVRLIRNAGKLTSRRTSAVLAASEVCRRCSFVERWRSFLPEACGSLPPVCASCSRAFRSHLRAYPPIGFRAWTTVGAASNE